MLCWGDSVNLKSLIALTFFVVGCGYKRPQGHASDLMSLYKAHWFTQSPDNALIDQSGLPAPHLFYDVSPEFGRDQRIVNVIITTPEGSPHAYGLDMVSGQRFYTHSYCGQKDIWHKRSGSVERPSYSIGHIPRFLDQLGGPQKVIIFGDQKRIMESVNHNYFRVKVIGAYIEQSCPAGNCIFKASWPSRLVFIGVDPLEPKYTQIDDLPTFLKTVKWEDVQMDLENIDGRNSLAGQMYPIVKVGNTIDWKPAFDYFKKNSIFLSDSELSKIGKGCRALYDKFWIEVGEPKKEFAENFKKFTSKYYDEFVTCQKFVYAGNVNSNPEKFWFLAYMRAFYLLNKEGHYFSCKNDSWNENLRDDRGNLVFDIKHDLNNCSDRDFDLAMDYMPNYLTGLKNSMRPYFKFIDYDNHVQGSHAKLYNWVRMDTKSFECSKDINEMVRKKTKILPEDIQWVHRSSERQTNKAEEVIK